MSYTNFINYDTVTIIQGVGGIRLCEEAWMEKKEMNTSHMPSPQAPSEKDASQEHSSR